ncbi:hypothetical protein EV177_002654 [Coemansia sp. RSA 1804]|nr:hypothetical protein EV177_002654 [Coemansia sp. RSA 1804]
MKGPGAVTTHYVTRESFAEHGIHKLLPSVSTGLAVQNTNTESSTFIKESPYLMLTASLTSIFYRFPDQGKITVDVIIRNAPVLVTLALSGLEVPPLRIIINLRSINLTVGPQPLIIEDGKRYTLEFAFSLVSQSTQSLVLSEFPYDYSIIQTIAQYPGVQNLVHLNFDSVKL